MSVRFRISFYAILPAAAFAAAALLLSGCRQEQQPAKAEPEPPRATRLVFGGDVMLSRYVGVLARRKNDPAWLFRDLAPYFSSADIAFVNLESPFSDRGAPTEKGMVFRASPGMVEGLTLAGIDVVSTANNHARDGGSYGLTFTLGLLAKNGIAAAGTGTDADQAYGGAILERNGVRFGFLAFTYDQLNGNHPKPDERIAMLDIERMRGAVKQMLTRADVVTVSMHAGYEYHAKPNDQQRAFARAAIDAGAQVVAGHHPHVVQPVEPYRDGVIFYSLGNLVFDQFQRKETQEGLVAEVVFRGNKMESFETRRVEIRQTAPRLAAELDTQRPGGDLDTSAGAAR